MDVQAGGVSECALNEGSERAKGFSRRFTNVKRN